MSWKIAQTIALMSMAVIFGLVLLWIFGRALLWGGHPANTGGVSFVAGGVRFPPLSVVLAVAAVVAAAELLLHRKGR